MSKYVAKPKDKFGNRTGTIASAVNAVMSTKWQTVEEIAGKTGLPVSSVRSRLQEGKAEGLYDYTREIKFKLKNKK